MFGHRPDGRRLKTLPPFFKVIPNVMLERNDSQVLFKQDVSVNSLDEYIEKKAEEGIKLSYMHIVYAAIVRVIGEKPQLNRFAMNGSIYARNEITVALAIKKNLTDEGEETTTKLSFTGAENIFEIKEKVDQILEENKDISADNNTDIAAKILDKLPNGLVRIVVKLCRLLDRHGMLPKSIIDLSPFHTSVFLTNVASLGIDSIYHHIYNFGTTSLFLSMGRRKKSYIYEDEEFKEERCITIAFVGDERICDGFNYAGAFRLLAKYLRRPELLEENIEPKQDIK